MVTARQIGTSDRVACRQSVSGGEGEATCGRMRSARAKPYPTDASDEEWAFVAPRLALLPEGARQRRHDLRLPLRDHAGRRKRPNAAILGSRTLRSTPDESGLRAGWGGAKWMRGPKPHAAVDTLGHLPALHVTPAAEQDRV